MLSLPESHAQSWTDSRNASNIQTRSLLMYSWNETSNDFKEEATAHFRGPPRCIYPLLPSLPASHTKNSLVDKLAAIWVQNRNHHEVVWSIYTSNTHSIIHTKIHKVAAGKTACVATVFPGLLADLVQLCLVYGFFQSFHIGWFHSFFEFLGSLHRLQTAQEKMRNLSCTLSPNSQS